jgi:hypothetical protein
LQEEEEEEEEEQAGWVGTKAGSLDSKKNTKMARVARALFQQGKKPPKNK